MSELAEVKKYLEQRVDELDRKVGSNSKDISDVRKLLAEAKTVYLEDPIQIHNNMNKGKEHRDVMSIRVIKGVPYKISAQAKMSSSGRCSRGWLTLFANDLEGDGKETLVSVSTGSPGDVKEGTTNTMPPIEVSYVPKDFKQITLVFASQSCHQGESSTSTVLKGAHLSVTPQ